MFLENRFKWVMRIPSQSESLLPNQTVGTTPRKKDHHHQLVRLQVPELHFTKNTSNHNRINHHDSHGQCKFVRMIGCNPKFVPTLSFIVIQQIQLYCQPNWHYFQVSRRGDRLNQQNNQQCVNVYNSKSINFPMTIASSSSWYSIHFVEECRLLL